MRTLHERASTTLFGESIETLMGQWNCVIGFYWQVDYGRKEGRKVELEMIRSTILNNNNNDEINSPNERSLKDKVSRTAMMRSTHLLKSS